MADLSTRSDIPGCDIFKDHSSTILHALCGVLYNSKGEDDLYSPALFRFVVKSLDTSCDFVKRELLILKKWAKGGRPGAQETLDRFEAEFLRSYEDPTRKRPDYDFNLLLQFAEWGSPKALEIAKKDLHSLLGIKKRPAPPPWLAWVDETRCKVFLEAVLESLRHHGIVYDFFCEATRRALCGEMELKQVKGICFAWKMVHDDNVWFLPLRNILKISIPRSQMIEASNRSLDWALVMRKLLVYRARILKALDAGDTTGEEDLVALISSSKFEGYISAKNEARRLLEP